MTVGTEPAEAERDTLATRIGELEVAAAICRKELCVVLQVVQSLNIGFAAGKDSENAVGARAFEMSENMSDIRALLEGLRRIVGGKRGTLQSSSLQN